MRTIPAVGIGSGPALVLLRFVHFQGDMRSLPEPYERALEDRLWKRTIFMTSDGRRYKSDLFTEGSEPTRLWLHNRGRVLVHDGANRLREYVVQLPR